jgi:serine O-acetyltransferase
MTLRELRDLVSSDIERFAEHCDMKLTFRRRLSVFLMPSIQSIFMYRLSRYFFLHGWVGVARLLYTLNLMMWGADISSVTKIGRSFYMPHPVGVSIFGILGDRCTAYTQAGVGGGSGDETDIGAGRGLPILGDGVLVGARSLVIGPIRIGEGSLIGAGSLVTFNVPDYSTVVSQTAKIL